MSERPTPETDAFVRHAFGEDGLGEDYDAYVAAVKLCRQLERERDEARDDLEFRRELYALQTERLQRIESERDEAREIIAAALHALPVGYIPAHTADTIPARIADLAARLHRHECAMFEVDILVTGGCCGPSPCSAVLALQEFLFDLSDERFDADTELDRLRLVDRAFRAARKNARTVLSANPVSNEELART